MKNGIFTQYLKKTSRFVQKNVSLHLESLHLPRKIFPWAPDCIVVCYITNHFQQARDYTAAIPSFVQMFWGHSDMQLRTLSAGQATHSSMTGGLPQSPSEENRKKKKYKKVPEPFLSNFHFNNHLTDSEWLRKKLHSYSSIKKCWSRSKGICKRPTLYRIRLLWDITGKRGHAYEVF